MKRGQQDRYPSRCPSDTSVLRWGYTRGICKVPTGCVLRYCTDGATMPSDGTVSGMQEDSLSHRYWATSLPSAPPSQDTGHRLEQPLFSDLPGSSDRDRNGTLLQVRRSKGAQIPASRITLLRKHPGCPPDSSCCHYTLAGLSAQVLCFLIHHSR